MNWSYQISYTNVLKKKKFFSQLKKFDKLIFHKKNEKQMMCVINNCLVYNDKYENIGNSLSEIMILSVVKTDKEIKLTAYIKEFPNREFELGTIDIDLENIQSIYIKTNKQIPQYTSHLVDVVDNITVQKMNIGEIIKYGMSKLL